jgi:hypothetical protein
MPRLLAPYTMYGEAAGPCLRCRCELTACYAYNILRYDSECMSHLASQLIDNSLLGRCVCMPRLLAPYTMYGEAAGPCLRCRCELTACYAYNILRYDSECMSHLASQLIDNSLLGRCGCMPSLLAPYTMYGEAAGPCLRCRCELTARYVYNILRYDSECTSH